jgi:putative transposase
MQNDFIERFNRLYGEAILDAYVFMDLEENRCLVREWKDEYNYLLPKFANQQLSVKRVLAHL